ncbi:Arc family DNA-binding protein [Rhizobium sp. AG207R]|uniref:Arc family DNA-binding protein n=1 Tax=Rhizobium sp. AG207R TaxID=2802287 RepID=UPI0022ABF431|nr:Arc family DNA-binding protein [Rhizobium sp. AG207R]MCZ3377463.1 Arc family DNA-binding protein [Rhizobium sp. AG207R]
MSDESPSRSLDKIIIRLPDGLKERIQRAAVENGRSVNSELVALLEREYPPILKLNEQLQEIVDLIAKFPPDEREEVWENARRKLEEARPKPNP